MGMMNFIFCVGAAISMATLAAGCANQPTGSSAQAAIQGAVNAIGASLGGQQASAAAIPSESSFKDILVANSSLTVTFYFAMNSCQFSREHTGSTS